ncbi:hypothetical protein GTZ99_08540 [Novosphingobium sp. FSY-8]|uniref:peptidoglycan lytic exotransglycosylase n=2 Tax=Novosphingobium ovatum TaxID=1908523 RepID=A0ABW9XDJ3_9SPHN|nr:hypothetical protein [Novosphingobium ovatum]
MGYPNARQMPPPGAAQRGGPPVASYAAPAQSAPAPVASPAPAGPTSLLPPPPANAIQAGLRAGPEFSALGLTDATARPALVSFRESCPALVNRRDPSGLVQPEDWQRICASATQWPADNAAGFFYAHFETVVVGDGRAFVTGYYEPEIAGVRQRQPGYDTPVYAVPPDLVHARPGDAPVRPNGMTPFGRYDQNGQFTGYFDRAQIESGILAGRGLEIGWVADPVELFFLQVQGSGRLRGPDGSVIRIGYAADNGLSYVNIGAAMRERGLIGTGPGQYPGSMQGIMQYIREHPEQGQALMLQNRSYVFFRELTGDGPIGALGVPVRANVSIAVDPLFIPLGAPVALQMDRSAVSGLWVAQDTGGAIKGANRIDSFWGAGQEARTIAGGMASRGAAVVLLPRGALARAMARGAAQ